MRDGVSSEMRMERYRSGHNEAVLKTVWLHGHMGSNPILSVFPFIGESHITNFVWT